MDEEGNTSPQGFIIHTEMFASSSMMEVILARSLRLSGRCCKNWDMRGNKITSGLK
jgi:hypothetical protein